MRSVPAILPTSVASRQGASWRGVLALVEACLARREQRLQLAELTDDQLKDIGLSRADAERERRRRPWDGRR